MVLKEILCVTNHELRALEIKQTDLTSPNIIGRSTWRSRAFWSCNNTQRLDSNKVAKFYEILLEITRWLVFL